MKSTVKSIATGVAAVAAIGAAAAGVTSIASVTPTMPQVQPVAVGAPLPQDPPPPGANVPTPDQLTGLLNSLSDPGVSYTTKTGLVQGGIDPGHGHLFDHELRKAFRDGEFPLSFNVSNIQPSGPNAATADVAVSGPKLPAPVTRNLTFISQGGWALSQDSASQLLEAATSH